MRRRQLCPLSEKYKPNAFQTMSCWRNCYINSSSFACSHLEKPLICKACSGFRPGHKFCAYSGRPVRNGGGLKKWETVDRTRPRLLPLPSRCVVCHLPRVHPSSPPENISSFRKKGLHNQPHCSVICIWGRWDSRKGSDKNS